MNIKYDNPQIEDLISVHDSKQSMRRKIGFEITKSVKRRFDQLRAANTFYTFQQLGIGKVHSLEGNELDGCYGISIDKSRRIIIMPDAADCSAESLKVCDVIIIKGVVEYHGRKNEWILP